MVSTFWILASNSWMQTPQGFIIENGHLIPQDWLAIIFNPSFPYRLFHMAIAAFLSSTMFVGASAAWHLLRGNDSPAIRKMLSMAMWMALLVAPIQAVVGDMHGLNTLSISRRRSRHRRALGKSPRRGHAAAAVWPAGHGAGADPLWS
ncbi:cytochrome oxidase bd-II, subunit I [Klebsiella pneumoniae]|uniref:Cytochrome oxidase bd-II, subunit I n=1 Tax=Klebsiella pneumoniae TaxID=573 RepID=A0A378C5S1_KLEPN|nr:cytochrome oxidase bd-II, subunit I [Klebsiella pneumoniae]